MAKTYLGPRPGVAIDKQMASDLPSPFQITFSGEITTNKTGFPLGASSVTGTITDVWLSVGNHGKINVNPLSIEANVKINGTTCLTTNPKIAASTATGSQKTTYNSGTGITQAVVDKTAKSVAIGDVLSCDLVLVRTASPTTEIANPIVVVEIDPV